MVAFIVLKICVQEDSTVSEGSGSQHVLPSERDSLVFCTVSGIPNR